MTATYRKRHRGRPAGAAATCLLCGAGSTSPGFWARKAAATCLLTYPWRGRQAWQRGAAAAKTGAGSVGGRGPSHGPVCGAAAAAGRGAGAGTGTGEKSAGRGGRRRRRGPGPHREDEPGGGGLQPLQVTCVEGRRRAGGEVKVCEWSGTRPSLPVQLTRPLSPLFLCWGPAPKRARPALSSGGKIVFLSKHPPTPKPKWSHMVLLLACWGYTSDFPIPLPLLVYLVLHKADSNNFRKMTWNVKPTKH